MTFLTVCDHTYDIECVVLDKDGTLVDFNHMWSNRIRQAVEQVVAAAGQDELVVEKLCQTLGYLSETGAVIDNSPMAIGSIAQIDLVVGTVLYQNGRNWQEAMQLTHTIFSPILNAPPTAADIQPIGDVAGCCRRLAAAGLKIGVATSDNRSGTESTMSLLGIDPLINLIVCGDDPLPHKPDIAVLQHIAHQLETPLAKMMMVGDSVNDMLMGRDANIACSVGISGSLSGNGRLSAVADCTIPSIDNILIE